MNNKQKNYSIREIAKLVGVSRSTVSRAFNDGYVSGDVREKINAAVESLGYNKNMLAQKLRNNQSNFIGLIVPDISNEFFARIAREIEAVFMKQGYGLFLCNTDEKPDIQDFYLKNLLENRVDAIIITPCTTTLDDKFVKSGIPIVFADREIFGLQNENVAVVTCDNKFGGKIAAQELIRRGAKRILIVSNEQESSNSMLDRIVAFKSEAEKSGVVYLHHPIKFSTREAEQQTSMLLKNTDFDAVFCTQDLIAFGVLKALSKAHIRVPDDVQVVGFDGLEIGEYIQKPLSTVRQDVEKVGIVIAEVILKMIRKQEFPRRTVLPVEYSQRETTREIL